MWQCKVKARSYWRHRISYCEYSAVLSIKTFDTIWSLYLVVKGGRDGAGYLAGYFAIQFLG